MSNPQNAADAKSTEFGSLTIITQQSQKVKTFFTNYMFALIIRISAAICNSIVSGRVSINLKCFVLCLMFSIVIYIKVAPPKKERINSVFSGILRLPFIEADLSTLQTIIDIRFITKR